MGTADQRQYIRYPLGLEARIVVGNRVEVTRCTVSSISHAGAAVNLHISEPLTPGQNIMLEIKFPNRKTPINVIMKLRWFQALKDDENFNAAAGGIITQIKDDERKALLDYAYQQLLMTEK